MGPTSSGIVLVVDDDPDILEGIVTILGTQAYRLATARDGKKCMEMVHVVNAAGVCLFAFLSYDWKFIPDFLGAVTGWPIDTDECYRIGERIAQIRHGFNLREGLNPLAFEVPGRVLGNPPFKQGNVREVSVDLATQARDLCEAMGWDPVSARPSRERLVKLGLPEVAAAVGR